MVRLLRPRSHPYVNDIEERLGRSDRRVSERLNLWECETLKLSVLSQVAEAELPAGGVDISRSRQHSRPDLWQSACDRRSGKDQPGRNAVSAIDDAHADNRIAANHEG